MTSGRAWKAVPRRDWRVHQQTASERSPSRRGLEPPDPWTRAGLEVKGRPTVPDEARHLSSLGPPAGTHAAGPPAQGPRTRAAFRLQLPRVTSLQRADGRTSRLPYNVATSPSRTCAWTQPNTSPSTPRHPGGLGRSCRGFSGSCRRTEDLSPLHSTS